jgi:hypothetical protein
MPEPMGVPADVLMPEPPIALADIDAVVRDHADDVPDKAQGAEVKRVASWAPTTEQEAEWAMAQLAACHAERDALRAQAIGWQDEISRWLARAERPAINRGAFFEAALETYIRGRHATDPKLRTVHLPSGTLKVTVPKGGSVVVDDERALMLWLLSDSGSDTIPAEDIIKRPEPSVLVSELRKHVRAVEVDGEWRVVVPATGEQPPAVHAEPPKDPSYRVNPG